MFKHVISDDGLNVIKTTSYSEDVNESNRHVVMSKVEGYCIGEVNKLYERYCLDRSRNKLPMESVDNFIDELRTLAKICNFCVCLCDR